MSKEFKEIKEIIFKQLKRKLFSAGIKKIDQFKINFDLLDNEIYDSLDYMNIAVALEDKDIELDLSLNRNRFPRSLKDFFHIAKKDLKNSNISKKDKINLKLIFNILNVKKNDNVLVHSSFMKLANYKIDEKFFFEELQKKIGNNGTIFVKGANLKEYLLNKFSHKKTYPHQEFGILSKFIFSKKQSVRSKNPFDCLVGIGKYSNFCKKDNFCSYDDNSPWAHLAKINTKILMVDVDFFYCSYLHRTEFQMKVPYRSIKKFKKSYGNYALYARKKKKLYLHYNKVLDDNQIKKLTKKFTYKNINFYSISCNKLNKEVSRLLANNKKYFLKK